MHSYMLVYIHEQINVHDTLVLLILYSINSIIAQTPVEYSYNCVLDWSYP